MKNSSNLISYVFSQSWKTFTQYLFKIYRTFCLGMLAIFVGAILLVSLGAASHSGLNLEEASSWIKLITTGNIILCIVFIVFILWIAYGVYKNFLAIARDEDLGFSSFAFSLRNIFRLFIFSILGLILTAIGFLLFILPGFYMLGVLEVARGKLFCDEEVSPIGALKYAFSCTKNYFWKLVLLGLFFMALSSLSQGFLILVLYPFNLLMGCHAYYYFSQNDIELIVENQDIIK